MPCILSHNWYMNASGFLFVLAVLPLAALMLCSFVASLGLEVSGHVHNPRRPSPPTAHRRSRPGEYLEVLNQAQRRYVILNQGKT